MDTDYLTLPTGAYQMSYGMKAWIERPRGSNVPYTPSEQWLYRGNEGDDNAWRIWLAERVGRAGRR